jgi:hypothetical protein
MDKPQVNDELRYATYWDNRYKDEIVIISDASNITAGSRHKEKLQTYDWFRTWEHLETWIRNILLHKFTQPRVLHLGCGNSVCLKFIIIRDQFNTLNILI